MKRRRFMTAFGTVAVGSGMALGTGAFNATSANSDSSLSILTQQQGADLNIVPGIDLSSVTESDVGDHVELSPDTNKEQFTSDGWINFDALSIEDLPLAIVENPGQGMVNVQVAVAPGTPSSDVDFSNIIGIVNNDDRAYNVGFTYTGYGGKVGSESSDVITKSGTNGVFSFEVSGTQISPSGTTSGGKTPANKTEISGGGSSTAVNLDVDTDVTALTDEYGDVWNDPFDGAGGFGSGASLSEPLVSEITAVADEV